MIFHESHQNNKNADEIRPVDDSHRLDITIYLKRKDEEDGINQKVDSALTRKINIINYRKNAYKDEVDKIIAAFSNLVLIKAEPEMRRVRMSGTIGQLRNIFSVDFSHFKDIHDREFISYKGPHCLPDDICHLIESVQGLNTRPAFAPKQYRIKE